MKTTFLTVKKKSIFAVLLCVLLAGGFCATYFGVMASTTPKPVHTIVIDAGHGGIDGGAEGKTTGVAESDLNLAYAKTLKGLCEDFGIGVVMTRKNENGLYSPTASNKKKSEMEKRKQIIEDSNADLVVSVHMNSFKLSSCSGAQVYYASGNQRGRQLAENVQTSLHNSFNNAKKLPSVGDFFVLNCTSKPGILVEFGFLSNPQEEINLQNKDYMKSMCFSVLGGILEFFK